MLTPRRWELLERLQKLRPSSLWGLARELGPRVKRVREAVGQLMACVLVTRTKDRTCCVPYNVIQADFSLRAAARVLLEPT